MDVLKDFAPLVVAVSMIHYVMAALKHLRAKQYNDVGTLAVVFVTGVLVAGLLRASDFANGIEVAGSTLASLNIASIVLVGFALASTARTLIQTYKTVDSSQSSAEPKLIPPPDDASA